MNFPLPGTLVAGPNGAGSLRLERVLGNGAFGLVYKAIDTTDQMPYAVKFPLALVDFQGAVELQAFLNEIQAAQTIQHPNVVRVLYTDTQAPDMPPYLVMEYIEGGTLQDYLQRQRQTGAPIDLAVIQAWTDDLLAGIAAINASMLHRDLKPDNILIDGASLKIGDFGLSKMIGALTRSRTFKGGQHVLYMAPEGWKYEANAIQIDMYAMGIVLFELASLRYPYQLPEDLSDMEALRNMHLYTTPQRLDQVGADVPTGYSRVVSRLLEKNPRDRYVTWAEVQQDITRAWEIHQGTRPGPRESVAALLRETMRIQDEQTRRRGAERQREEEQEERLRLDQVQVTRLLDFIKAEIDEYNEHCSPQERMHVTQIQDALRVRLPFGQTLSLSFFPVDPPLSLSVGQVRFAGILQDADGGGLNYLLCREAAEDLYGTWRVCRVGHYPTMRPEKLPQRVTPFGFTSASDIRVIERADQAVHAYTVEFSDTLEDTFLQVAKSAIIRSQGSQSKGKR
jgi:serine/threonine protein kinase